MTHKYGKNQYERNTILEQKLEKIKESVLSKMNSTPKNFEESAVKVYAHNIYEIITGMTLSEELKEILRGKRN